MPIYEYKCKKCNETFEELQGFNDKPFRKCRECGGKLERLISLSAFHLKGSGWYETEYGKKKTKVTTESKNKNGHSEDAKSDTPEVKSGEDTVESIKKDTDKAKQNNPNP